MCSDGINAAAVAPALVWIIHAVVRKSEREKEGGVMGRGWSASVSKPHGRPDETG